MYFSKILLKRQQTEIGKASYTWKTQMYFLIVFLNRISQQTSFKIPLEANVSRVVPCLKTTVMKNLTLIFLATFTPERSVRIVKATALGEKRQARIKILIVTKQHCGTASVAIYPSTHKNCDRHENSCVATLSDKR